MSDLIKFEGWDFDATDAKKPRVRDLEIGERGGLSRPRDIRKLIERNAKTLRKFGELRMRATVARIEIRPGVYREQTVDEYWPNEAQAIWLVSRFETEQGLDLSVALVKLFVAWRDGLLVSTPTTTTIPLDVAQGPRVSGVPSLRKEISERCAAVAKSTGLSLARVHGWVRRNFLVPGIHQVAVIVLPIVLEQLSKAESGLVVLEPKKRLPGPRRPARPRLRRPAKARRRALSSRGQVTMPWAPVH